jgi:hypothetical protein
MFCVILSPKVIGEAGNVSCSTLNPLGDEKLVGTKRFGLKIPAWITAPIIAIFIAASIGCSGDAEEPSNVISESKPPGSNSITSSFSSEDPVEGDQEKQDAFDSAPAAAEEELEMASPLITPLEVPEPGSDEAKIYEVMTRRLKALNLQDYQGVMDTCDPRLSKPNTAEKLETLWETFATPYAPAMTYNRKYASIRFLKDGSGIMESDLYSYDEPMFPSQDSNAVIDSWHKVDGQWYISNIWCHSGNLRLKTDS